MSDKPRLQIRPHGEGRFAIFDGEGLMAVADTLGVAEAAKKYWQGQIDAGGSPTRSAGEVAGIVVEALHTEIELLKREKNSRQHGHDGWKKRQENNPPQELPWRASVQKRLANAPAAVRNLPHPQIYEWLKNMGVSKGRTVIMELLAEMEESGLLPPSRRK